MKKDEEKEKMSRDKNLQNFLFILEKSGDTECKVIHKRKGLYEDMYEFLVREEREWNRKNTETGISRQKQKTQI